MARPVGPIGQQCARADVADRPYDRGSTWTRDNACAGPIYFIYEMPSVHWERGRCLRAKGAAGIYLNCRRTRSMSGILEGMSAWRPGLGPDEYIVCIPS